jgi:hypothetical protein
MVDHCFVCGIKLAKATTFPQEEPCWPATEFTATGNWGSTILDGPEQKSWTIKICDGCIVARRESIQAAGEEVPLDIRDDVKEYLAQERLERLLLSKLAGQYPSDGEQGRSNHEDVAG